MSHTALPENVTIRPAAWQSVYSGADTFLDARELGEIDRPPVLQLLHSEVAEAVQEPLAVTFGKAELDECERRVGAAVQIAGVLLIATGLARMDQLHQGSARCRRVR